MDIISTETRLLHQITVKGIFNFLTDKNIIVKPIDVEGASVLKIQVIQAQPFLLIAIPIVDVIFFIGLGIISGNKTNNTIGRSFNILRFNLIIRLRFVFRKQ